MTEREALELGERVRAACVRAFMEGYEDAARSGLCGEGAVEAAVGAVRSLDIRRIAEVDG